MQRKHYSAVQPLSGCESASYSTPWPLKVAFLCLSSEKADMKDLREIPCALQRTRPLMEHGGAYMCTLVDGVQLTALGCCAHGWMAASSHPQCWLSDHVTMLSGLWTMPFNPRAPPPSTVPETSWTCYFKKIYIALNNNIMHVLMKQHCSTNYLLTMLNKETKAKHCFWCKIT